MSFTQIVLGIIIFLVILVLIAIRTIKDPNQ
jgi:hypothetical protein